MAKKGRRSKPVKEQNTRKKSTDESGYYAETAPRRASDIVLWPNRGGKPEEAATASSGFHQSSSDGSYRQKPSSRAPAEISIHLHSTDPALLDTETFSLEEQEGISAEFNAELEKLWKMTEDYVQQAKARRQRRPPSLPPVSAHTPESAPSTPPPSLSSHKPKSPPRSHRSPGKSPRSPTRTNDASGSPRRRIPLYFTPTGRPSATPHFFPPGFRLPPDEDDVHSPGFTPPPPRFTFDRKDSRAGPSSHHQPRHNPFAGMWEHHPKPDERRATKSRGASNANYIEPSSRDNSHPRHPFSRTSAKRPRLPSLCQDPEECDLPYYKYKPTKSRHMSDDRTEDMHSDSSEDIGMNTEDIDLNKQAGGLAKKIGRWRDTGE